MSGSGGSGGGGGFGPGPEDCSSLVFDTQLSSPKAAVVAHIRVDDELKVATKVFDGTTVVVVLRRDQVAGGLASPQIQRLRECIAKGTQFIATVTSISGGQVRVRVKAT